MVGDLITVERGRMQPLEYMDSQPDYLSIDQQALPPINLRGCYTCITHWVGTKPLKKYRCRIPLTVTPNIACALKTTPYHYPDQTREKQIFSLPVKTLKNAKLVYG